MTSCAPSSVRRDASEVARIASLVASFTVWRVLSDLVAMLSTPCATFCPPHVATLCIRHRYMHVYARIMPLSSGTMEAAIAAVQGAHGRDASHCRGDAPHPRGAERAAHAPSLCEWHMPPEASMVECVAVTVAQIRQYHLLTRPPKPLDSRTAWYEDMFPDLGCVELHAIAPEDLVAIVRGAIECVITDRASWALPPPLHHPCSR